MIRELGYCSGIENYSRFFDGRQPGMRPFCLLDYFPDDYLMVIDESHVTVPQIRAMYGGDRSRKLSLVEYGFRLPAALDNRPLNFDEFERLAPQTIYVSATPGDYELEKTEGVVVEQVIRPTGIIPATVGKSRQAIIEQTSVVDFKGGVQKAYIEKETADSIAADPIVQYMGKPELQKAIDKTKKDMLAAAKDMDFLLAAKLRDEMFALEKMMNERFGGVRSQKANK